MQISGGEQPRSRLLIVCQQDENVDPASTCQTAGALIRAGFRFRGLTLDLSIRHTCGSGHEIHRRFVG